MPNPGLELACQGAAYDVIQAPLLRGFPALVRKLGGDPQALLGPLGLSVEQCEQPAVMTCRQWLAALDAAAQVLDAPTFGLMLAERQGGDGVYGPLGAAMRNACSFGAALRYVVAHNAAHSLAVRLWMLPDERAGQVFVGHDILVETVASRAQAMEQVMLAAHLGARLLTGDMAGVRRVHFRHQAISPASVYRRHFGCEVRFCQDSDGVAFDLGALGLPVVDADSGAFARIAAEIERRFGGQRPPFHALVRGLVMQRLWTGQCRNEDVAEALNLHPRTLLRRLRDERTSFQKIKDEVRCDLMLYYLRETELDLSRISEKLGFAEQSVMSRFARACFGVSPSALRAAPTLTPSPLTSPVATPPDPRAA